MAESLKSLKAQVHFEVRFAVWQKKKILKEYSSDLALQSRTTTLLAPQKPFYNILNMQYAVVLP